MAEVTRSELNSSRSQSWPFVVSGLIAIHVYLTMNMGSLMLKDESAAAYRISTPVGDI